MLSPNDARIRSFEVVPSLPEPLKPLLTIAHNLWWTWHPEAVELFMRLDRALWQKTYHNPVKMLGECSQSVLDNAANNDGFLSSMQRVSEGLERHLNRTPWHEASGKDVGEATIAYFCTEFGMTESLQIYSGGLGCLAGDHLKSASELGLPLVAVGLLYRNGYFQQYLNADGWQQEYYPDLDFANLPTNPVLDDDGKQVRVSVQMPGRDVHIAVWKVHVGSVELYLLDTNLSENDPSDRTITSQLYGGDMEMRIKQEIVLGIGGVRALRAVGIKPDVFHMNEGHSAFLALEQIRHLIAEHDLEFDEARQQVAGGSVFTTHTPVPAGIDRFPPDLVTRYMKDFVPSLKLDMEGLLALGRENVFNKNEFFSMAVLAIRTADFANGVSKLHGEVSRDMWQGIWPKVPAPEVPIDHVTNGVHARSWLSGELAYLLNRYLGDRWQSDPVDHDVWKNVLEVPDEELWRVHERQRQKLIVWARRQLRKQLTDRGANMEQINEACETLSPNALTIGFARRFATYKRGSLFMRDAERLLKIINNTEKPVQFLIAGKAHPADGGGKDLIRQIVKFAASAKGGHRIVFLENYDIRVARYLVQGCDVWLNTPRRGMEASGTSGMKAALNGGLNCSILDGWWDEVDPNGQTGWSIGRGEDYHNPDTADEMESKALYELLENEIVPLFYKRNDQGVPTAWVKRMKLCIAQLAPAFNTNRMVQDYAEKLYLPALQRHRMLTKGGMVGAKELAAEIKRLRSAWPSLRVSSVDTDVTGPLGVRQSLPVSANVHLGEIKPDEVVVEVYYGAMDNDGKLVDGTPAPLKHAEDLGNGDHRFVGEIHSERSGRFGFAIRIQPGGPMFENVKEPGLIHWEGSADAAAAKPKSEKVA